MKNPKGLDINIKIRDKDDDENMKTCHISLDSTEKDGDELTVNTLDLFRASEFLIDFCITHGDNLGKERITVLKTCKFILENYENMADKISETIH